MFSIGLSQASLALTKEEVIEKVTKDPVSLQTLDAEFKKDKEVVIVAMRQDPDLFRNADEILQKDRGFMIYLMQDKAFVLTLASADGVSLVFADLKLSKDKEIVIAAVKQNKQALQYTDESTRDEIKFERDYKVEAIKTLQKCVAIMQKEYLKTPPDF